MVGDAMIVTRKNDQAQIEQTLNIETFPAEIGPGWRVRIRSGISTFPITVGFCERYVIESDKGWRTCASAVDEIMLFW
jgi:hypothetical protein